MIDKLIQFIYDIEVPTREVLNASILPTLCLYHLDQKYFLGNNAPLSS